MSNNQPTEQAATKAADTEEKPHSRRDLLLSIRAFLAYALLSFAVVLSPNLSLWRQALFAKGSPPASEKPLDITLLHTNDTWGYIEPCG